MCMIKSLVQLEEEGLVQLGRGKVISKQNLAANVGSYPVYSSSKVGDGKFGEYGLYMFDEELITWSVDGGGRLFHREKHKFSITNVTGFLRILDTSVLSYKYLFHALCLLHSRINFDWVKKAHPSVLRKEYVSIPIPPLAEQQRIVAKLDAAFAEIDRAVAIQEKTNVLISRAQKKLASSIFAGKQHDTSLWRSTVLGDICTATQGVQIPKSKQTSTYLDGYRRYLYISDFRHDKSLKYVEDKYPKKMVTTDDLIMSNTGSQGEVFRGVEGILSNNLFKIGVNKEVISADYLFNFLNSDVFIEYQNERTRGTTQPHMGHKNFLSTPILLPPLSIQNEVVTKLNGVNEMFECLAINNSRKNEQLFNLKSAFLAQELQPPQSEAA